jgi:di/tricarboxylate transporter
MGLAVIFVVGTMRPINLGALALVMTFIMGTLVVGEGVREMLAGFPVDLFVLLAGVTYLFAIASSNGTVERIVEGATRLIRGRRSLVPWIVFGVAALPALAGALGSAGVALFAPISLRLARRYDIDRRMVGLLVVHGAAAGNFSPLNVLGVIVQQSVARAGLQLSASTLFVANMAYNIALAAIIYVLFGGLQLGKRQAPARQSVLVAAGEGGSNAASIDTVSLESDPWRTAAAPAIATPVEKLRLDQLCTILGLIGVGVAGLVFDLNIGFLALAAAVLLQLLFPTASRDADKRIAWGVVLLVCGIVTYVAALQRYGTVDVVGAGIAASSTPAVGALLLCAVGALTSAFASSAGILGALIPLALPLIAQGGVTMTGLVIALAISITVVDGMPFSTVGALVVANAEEEERSRVYRGLLWWGALMIVTAPFVTWIVFVLLG